MMKREHRDKSRGARLALLALGLPLSLAAVAQTTSVQQNTPGGQPAAQVQAQQAGPVKPKKTRHKARRKSANSAAQANAKAATQAEPSPAAVQMHAPRVDPLVEPNAVDRLASGSPDQHADQAVRADNPKQPQSSQSQSKGFIADSSLTLNLRNYLDHFDNEGGPHRHAWVQGAMLDYTSGYTQGPIGLGLDASLYGALKLDGGQGAGNMVHVGKDGGGSNQLAWAYPGIWDVKARVSDTVAKYGLQMVSDNPFFEPHDNRALPPTFLGASLVSKDVSNAVLQAGSFTKVNPRGHTNLVDLSTSYGGVKFKRFSYLGGSWDYSKDGSLSLFANQADDVWRQYYA
ncbi:OprD family outer membrane porin, partial [Paraburkholderia sp. J8-2]|uniref:OprD family outer membrane porin n=1 Tax=Paraburkholderia sp. J8-2 TaxID=2805440 RepID=UPI002AB69173